MRVFRIVRQVLRSAKRRIRLRFAFVRKPWFFGRRRGSSEIDSGVAAQDFWRFVAIWIPCARIPIGPSSESNPFLPVLKMLLLPRRASFARVFQRTGVAVCFTRVDPGPEPTLGVYRWHHVRQVLDFYARWVVDIERLMQARKMLRKKAGF